MIFKFEASKLFARQPDGSYRLDAEGTLRVTAEVQDVMFTRDRGVSVKFGFSFAIDGKIVARTEDAPWINLGDAFSLDVDIPYKVTLEDK